ncbi:hypothetical protein FA13DRAFT_1025804 [Coprinellus micaceus]|uniref:TAFII55 protein conserved region domain-containing protein n=1 Tax=Coprinellus micaceus TaxID=71717 RepID=A0A4Y7SY32_COPMI|nr:hypothetical protein FA13DRAFT_1025804 [Coprinellus micaceus]
MAAMDDDLIVVDDFEHTQPINHRSSVIQNASQEGTSSITSRLRTRNSCFSTTSTSYAPAMESTERTTRSSASKPKLQPKLKLKLSEKAAAQAPGMSFLGAYDRELDSDDEDLSFEEQFILRLPPGEDLEKLRKMVASREMTNDVWFKFKDSRRGVFHIGNNLYSTKLVDLPCIVESQKTMDNKQMFKIADICQMLVVENKISEESSVTSNKNFNIDEFIWPHGITPPLHHVRKRRFRKRVNRRTIESVEQEVERLLDEDAMATEVKYEVLENVNPDLSDSEFIEQEVLLDAPTPAISDLGEGMGGDLGEGDEDEGAEGNESEPEQEGDIDEELAAELDMALGDEDEGAADEEEEEEDESEEDDDDDEDDDEAEARHLLSEEIRDLEAAVAKKQNEIAASSNPLIRKRFEDALKKLTVDLEMKRSQRDEMREKQRLKKEGIQPGAGDSDAEQGGDDGGEEGEDEDLFGPEEGEAGMDLG